MQICPATSAVAMSRLSYASFMINIIKKSVETVPWGTLFHRGESFFLFSSIEATVRPFILPHRFSSITLMARSAALFLLARGLRDAVLRKHQNHVAGGIPGTVH